MNRRLSIVDCRFGWSGVGPRQAVLWVAALALLGLGCLLPERAAGGELPRFVVAHGFGDDHPVHQGLGRFRERLDGIVHVEVKTRWDDLEAVGAMLAGQIHAAVVSPAAVRNVVREMALLEIMGLWRDRGHWERSLDGEAGRRLAAMASRRSAPGSGTVHVLGFWGGTLRHLLTRRDGVTTIQALAGLRLGIPINPVRSKMWKAVGAVPVLVPLADASAALRDGTVDGIEEEADVIVRARLFEGAQHLSETGHAIATRLFLIAGPTWTRLAREQQAAMAAAARDATLLARGLEVQREAEALAALRDKFGVASHRFAELDLVMDRARPLRYRYAEELGTSDILRLIEQPAGP